jgi:hypothetical protein
MTEEEWGACDDPLQMLMFLKRKAGDRKLRLLACASCRCRWSLLPAPAQRLVEAAERLADGGLTPHQWAKVRRGASRTEKVADFEPHLLVARRASAELTCQVVLAATQLFYHNLVPAGGYDLAASEAYRREWASQAELVREVFGNPFRPPSFDDRWRSGDVLSLARHIYESKDFSAMPILADALQEAGCTSEELLAHLRTGGPHVRGCWALDVVLGKQ